MLSLLLHLVLRKFKSGEIVGDDPFGYHAQLAGYEAAMWYKSKEGS